MKKAIEKMFDGTTQERVFLAENSFLLFALYYFSDYFEYQIADFHKDFSQDLHDLLNLKIKELGWIAFRESAKTTFAKIFIIYLVAYKKRKYINVDSFDKENAERILFDVAFELTNNLKLKNDFGVLFSKQKSLDEIKQNRINNFVTENGIRVEAHSTQESMRGRIHLNQRPDFLLIDDFETNKTKTSEAFTKQIKNHISEAMAGMSPDGVIHYLGNYITEYGNVQYLLDRAKSDPMIRIRNIPVILENGLPAWPGKYCLTDEEVKTTGKISIESKMRQLGSLVFSYEMMNKPIDDMTAEFKKDYVQYATLEEVQKMNTLCHITIDSAVSEKDSSDYTGVTINWVNEQNKWFAKTYRLKVNSKGLIDHLFFLYETYKPYLIGLEETTFTMAIKPFIDEEMRKRNVFFVLTPLKHRSIQKETRIRGLIPFWESRTIFLVGDSLELLDEMRTFPNGQFDDVLDSLAMQIGHIEKPNTVEYEEPFIEDTPLYPSIGI